MKKIIILACLMAMSSTASAWGDREQGILTGIIGTKIIQNVLTNTGNGAGQGMHRHHQPPVVIHQYPVPTVQHHAPSRQPVIVCQNIPLYGADNHLIRYHQVCHYK